VLPTLRRVHAVMTDAVRRISDAYSELERTDGKIAKAA
jgi:hypothetical protein